MSATLLYEIQPEHEDGKINCGNCGQDRTRLLIEAASPEEARERFRRREGVCSGCWADTKQAKLLLVSDVDIAAYEGR